MMLAVKTDAGSSVYIMIYYYYYYYYIYIYFYLMGESPNLFLNFVVNVGASCPACPVCQAINNYAGDAFSKVYLVSNKPKAAG